jgi:hypothetical protein
MVTESPPVSPSVVALDDPEAERDFRNFGDGLMQSRVEVADHAAAGIQELCGCGNEDLPAAYGVERA